MPGNDDRSADFREIADLRERARRARYVAWQINDKEAAAGLMRHAEELETRASDLVEKYTLPQAATEVSGEPPIAQAAAALKPETSPEPEPVSAPSNDKPTSSDKPEPEPV